MENYLEGSGSTGATLRASGSGKTLRVRVRVSHKLHEVFLLPLLGASLKNHFRELKANTRHLVLTLSAPFLLLFRVDGQAWLKQGGTESMKTIQKQHAKKKQLPFNSYGYKVIKVAMPSLCGNVHLQSQEAGIGGYQVQRQSKQLSVCLSLSPHLSLSVCLCLFLCLSLKHTPHTHTIS